MQGEGCCVKLFLYDLLRSLHSVSDVSNTSPSFFGHHVYPENLKFPTLSLFDQSPFETSRFCNTLLCFYVGR